MLITAEKHKERASCRLNSVLALLVLLKLFLLLNIYPILLNAVVNACVVVVAVVVFINKTGIV